MGILWWQETQYVFLIVHVTGNDVVERFDNLVFWGQTTLQHRTILHSVGTPAHTQEGPKLLEAIILYALLFK